MAFLYGGCLYMGGFPIGPGLRIPNTPLPRQQEASRSPSPSSQGKVADTKPSTLSFSIDSILADSPPKNKRSSANPLIVPRYVPAAYSAAFKPEEDEHEEGKEDVEEKNSDDTYSWLHCTRYKPPKLPRIKRKDSGKKRKLGRNPRVPFTQHQVLTLEEKFRRTHYLSSVDVAELSTSLNLTETRVKIWFQNRRARERRDRETPISGELTPLPLGQPTLTSSTWPIATGPLMQYSKAVGRPSAFNPLAKFI